MQRRVSLQARRPYIRPGHQRFQQRKTSLPPSIGSRLRTERAPCPTRHLQQRCQPARLRHPPPSWPRRPAPAHHERSALPPAHAQAPHQPNLPSTRQLQRQAAAQPHPSARSRTPFARRWHPENTAGSPTGTPPSTHPRAPATTPPPASRHPPTHHLVHPPPKQG